MTDLPPPRAGQGGSPAYRVVQLNSELTGGGTDDQSLKLTSGLSRLGHDVWIAGPDGRHLSRAARESGGMFHATPPEGLLKLKFILSVGKLVRQQRIQIVHGHHGRDLWPTVLAARLSGTSAAVVITRHLAKSPSSWFSRYFLLGRCDAMVAVSRFVARVLREGVFDPHSPEIERRERPRIYGDKSKIHVIHGGVDTDRFRPFEALEQRARWGVRSEHFVFAAVGAYDLPRGKGQREFLRAAATLHVQFPQARFLLVGRGTLRETLEIDIAKLGLKGKAWLTGYCDDMPTAMNAIDCLVHAQVGTEAFAGVVLEALACGRPVIASALDGIPEAFEAGEFGSLIPPENLDALTASMKDWATRPPVELEYRRELNRAVANAFSLETCARNYSALYRKLRSSDPMESE